ncbi:MAG: type IV pilus assembly protein PilM [Candidatus Taylorbacteria bacterium]
MSFLSKLFKKNDRSVLGVDIGPSSIKLVQLRKEKGKAVLETYGALALGPYAGLEVGRATHLPPGKVAEALNDILKEANATTKKCGISISMSSSLISLIEVPTTDQKQIADMIPLEARKYIPVSISEVTLDWWILPREDKIWNEEEEIQGDKGNNAPVLQKKLEKTQVLLVVIHNDALNDMREIVRLSQLDSSFFEIEIFSTIRAVLDAEVSPVMIFDMGASSTKLYVVERGILKTSHIIDRGSQDLTLGIARAMSVSVEEAENLKRTKGLDLGGGNKDMQGIMLSTLDYIFSESNRLLLSYQKKYNKNVGKVVLTGGGSGLQGFLKMAEQAFQVQVISADPFSKVEAPAFLANILKSAGPEFAVAVGLALRKLQEVD